MTHFLARLVNRARTTAPRVEPIVASRFAPVSPSDIAAPNASRVTRNPITPLEIETQPRETENQSRVPPPQLEIQGELAETRSRGTALPAKIEAAPHVTKGEPSLISEPMKIFRESLLVRSDRHTHAPWGTTPAREVLENDVAAQSARQPRTRDTPQKEKSAAQIPALAPVPLDDETHHESAERSGPQKEEPHASLGSAQLVEEARSQPIDQSPRQKAQPPVAGKTPRLLPLRERLGDQDNDGKTPQRKQTGPPLSAPRLSPVILREESREQAPVVRVTIGRIEVRATSDSGPHSRKPARLPAPRLTLDAYLKSRKGAAR